MNTQTLAARESTLSPSRREGLTAIFRKAQKRVLPTVPGWLNPEDSIGHYIGKAKWDHIWEAIGPARDAFNTIAPKIKEYLEKGVEPISSRVTWSMYMIGRSANLASPSIIFCCDVLQHRREVRNTIKDSGILNGYPGIKTGHLPRPPDFDQLVPLGAGAQLPCNFGDKMALLSRAKSACGSQILVNTSGSSSVSLAAVATIGGVIRLGENLYYTTVAHALTPSPDPGNAEKALPTDDNYDTDDDALSLDGDEDMCGDMCGASESNPSTEKPLPRIREFSEDSRYTKDNTLREWSLKLRHNRQEPSSLIAYSEELSLNPIGRLFISSLERGTQGAGLDYALMEISSRNHLVENVIEIGTTEKTTVNVHSVNRSEPQDVRIIAVTPRGTINGWISGTPVYSCTPGTRSYSRMFKITLSDPIQRGDCGTWVVDATNGNLFGHIVLGSPDGGAALLVPFSDIFDDILSRVGEWPVFPTALDDQCSFNSAATQRSPIPREKPVLNINLNTISVMSRSSELHSPRDSVADISIHVSSMKGGSQIKGPIDLNKGERKSKESIEKVLSVSESGTRELTVSKRDSAMIATSPHLSHQQMTSQLGLTTRDWVAYISKEFRRLMDQKRLKSSRQRDSIREFSGVRIRARSSLHGDLAPRQRSTVFVQSAQPRSYIPLHIETRQSPAATSYYRFRHLLFELCNVPVKWENQELLKLALKEIDLKAIYSDAKEESEHFISLARRRSVDTKPEWGYQDCVVQVLSRYFSRSFFTWVSNPPCEACGSNLPTIHRGNAQPNFKEKAGRAEAVELYQCAEKHCQAYTRFPRYWDARTLLRTRRGRASEGANCFGMICRALGFRVRWVWNPEDDIWIEVYSEHQERWVHVDPCMTSWDNPLLYTEAVGQKLSYCIAFCLDGAADVTRRYVRTSKHAVARTRCSESELLSIIHDTKSMRRIDMPNKDLVQLDREEKAEAEELASYIVPSDVVGAASHWQPVEVKLAYRKSLVGMIPPRTNSVSAPLITFREEQP